MKKILVLVLALSCAAGVVAQDKPNSKKAKKEEKRKRIDALVKQEEEGVIAYKRQTVYGLKLISDGYGFFAEVGRAKSVKKSMLYQFEISERKHQKEEKTTSLANFSAPYIYGKINYFYPVKLGVQQQYLFGNKSNKNGVTVTGNIGGGLSLGLLRPYMIEVDKNGARTYVRYDSPDSSYFIGAYHDNTASGPGLGTGWKYLSVTPGLYVKPAVRFDYGKLNELVSAIEVGVSAEYYSKKIPQMLYNKEKQFFFSAYFALMFGRRK
ncbi:MAG: hypothetical protein JST86_17705 [Bacteroidetes bacterium]|nr:hypothetical protein [Bacteroidota bacterium]